jgi:hypothetical protein
MLQSFKTENIDFNCWLKFIPLQEKMVNTEQVKEFVKRIDALRRHL